MQKVLKDKIAHVVKELKRHRLKALFCTEWSQLLEKWKCVLEKSLNFLFKTVYCTCKPWFLYMTWVGSSCWWGGKWGAPCCTCCRALKVMTHFTLSCDGVLVRVVCIQLSRELTNTAELYLPWFFSGAPTLKLNVEFCNLQLLILKMND